MGIEKEQGKNEKVAKKETHSISPDIYVVETGTLVARRLWG